MSNNTSQYEALIEHKHALYTQTSLNITLLPNRTESNNFVLNIAILPDKLIKRDVKGIVFIIVLLYCLMLCMGVYCKINCLLSSL